MKMFVQIMFASLSSSHSHPVVWLPPLQLCLLTDLLPLTMPQCVRDAAGSPELDLDGRGNRRVLGNLTQLVNAQRLGLVCQGSQASSTTSQLCSPGTARQLFASVSTTGN